MSERVDLEALDALALWADSCGMSEAEDVADMLEDGMSEDAVAIFRANAKRYATIAYVLRSMPAEVRALRAALDSAGQSIRYLRAKHAGVVHMGHGSDACAEAIALTEQYAFLDPLSAGEYADAMVAALTEPT